MTKEHTVAMTKEHTVAKTKEHTEAITKELTVAMNREHTVVINILLRYLCLFFKCFFNIIINLYKTYYKKRLCLLSRNKLIRTTESFNIII